MEIDLEAVAPRSEPFRSRVCIIGAGIAGLTLAHRLAQQGIDVLLLEAGGLKLNDTSQSLFHDVSFPSHKHAGTHEGRFRVLGGASVRWGGQLLAPPASLSPDWPVPAIELETHYRAAEELLGIDALPYDGARFFAEARQQAPSFLAQLPDITPRLSKWAPFSHRDMASTLGEQLRRDPRVTLCLNAPVHELLLASDQTRIEAALLRMRSGNLIRITAQHFIVAAGTIETVRLLLASRSVAPEGVGNQHDQLGRNFHDHLTLPAATLSGAAREVFAREIRPWLHRGTLHTLKLEASPTLCRDLDINPALAHFTFDEPEGSGLSIVREILTARQHGTFARTLAANALRLPNAFADVAKLAFTAKLKHRRYVAPSTQLTLRINAAQDAPSSSRILLSPDRDATDLPKAIVDWRISPRELDTLHRFATHLRTRFEAIGLWDGIAWAPELFNSGQYTDAKRLPLLDDARHAMGGATMSIDPRAGVTTPDLAVHGLANLHLASCATFPSGSPQLPTLTLMALTLRLADHLTARLASAPAS